MSVNNMRQITRVGGPSVLMLAILVQLWGCAGTRASNVSPDGPRLTTSIDRMAVTLGQDTMTTELEVTLTGLSDFRGYWYSFMVFQYLYCGSFYQSLGLSGEQGLIFDTMSDSTTLGRRQNLLGAYDLNKEDVDAWTREGGEWVLIPIVYIYEKRSRGEPSRVIYSMVGEPKTFSWARAMESPSLVPTFRHINGP